MVGSVTWDLQEQVKNNQYVNQTAGNGGQKMSQYSWFTVYKHSNLTSSYSQKLFFHALNRMHYSSNRNYRQSSTPRTTNGCSLTKNSCSFKIQIRTIGQLEIIFLRTFRLYPKSTTKTIFNNT